MGLLICERLSFQIGFTLAIQRSMTKLEYKKILCFYPWIQPVKNWIPDILSQSIEISKKDLQSCQDAYLKIKESAIQYCTYFCKNYPGELKELDSPPPVLTYLGDLECLKRKRLSIVGTRTPQSHTEKWMMTELRSFLYTHHHKICSLSGGARGVDQWVHELSIRTHTPTVALLPSGLGEIYPKSFQALIPEILKAGGALISSYAPWEPMRKQNFYVRNQWIAALSEDVLVLEAGQRGGSLITAQHAINFGKNLLVVGSHPSDQKYKASNELLYSGAQMIRDQKDLEVSLRL